jgi:hypothetical protein
MSFPTHCHLDGELFLFRMASPRETSLVIWGFERANELLDQDEDSLSQITAKNEIVKGDIPLMRALVCETRQIKLEYVLQWLVLQGINDYLYHIYEQ